MCNRLTDVAIKFIDKFNAGELPVQDSDEIIKFAKKHLQWHVAIMKAREDFKKIAEEKKISVNDFSQKQREYLEEKNGLNIRQKILESWTELKTEYGLLSKNPQFFVKMMKVISELLIIRKGSYCLRKFISELLIIRIYVYSESGPMDERNTRNFKRNNQAEG